MHRDGIVTDLGVPAPDNTFPAPDFQEVKEEIGRLKNHKAAGIDQLPAELLKHGGETLAKALHWVITKIWDDVILPEEWMEGVPSTKKATNWIAVTIAPSQY